MIAVSETVEEVYFDSSFYDDRVVVIFKRILKEDKVVNVFQTVFGENNFPVLFV